MFSTPRGRRIGWVVVYVCVAAFILGIVAVIAAIRQTQIEGTPTGRRLLEASDRILDCTDPAGVCYQRNQERTADVIGDVNRVAVYAAACADQRGIQGEDEIYACVVRLIAQADKHDR